MRIKNIFQNLTSNHSITNRILLIIFFLPIILTIIYNVLLIIPSSRSFAFWLQNENHPIETLTFMFFLFGGAYGLYLTLKTLKYVEKPITFFYVVFSVFLILIAMEEIAWGQWFFNFETPNNWAKINTQGETTIHNLKRFHGHNEILRLLFGIGGIVGVFFGKLSKLKRISVNKILIPWFIIIIFHSIADMFTNSENVNLKIYRALQANSEFIE